MYLTLIPVVNGDDYQQHKNVRQIFPGDQKVLFQQSDSCIAVVSPEKPVGNFQTKEIDASTSFVEGKQYPFTMRLNPAKRDLNTHKRVAIEADRVKSWINKKLLGAGVEAKFQYIREGVRRSIKQNKTISLVSVLCFGVITIKDVTAFQQALIGGVGNSKGLGFGMLNVFAD
jgi:CRISPR-associated protein Cas6/Cse3/CasE subtype I-E